MSEKEEKETKGGFLSRFMKKKESECGCGCCGGMRIVPKESSTGKEDPEKEEDS